MFSTPGSLMFFSGMLVSFPLLLGSDSERRLIQLGQVLEGRGQGAVPEQSPLSWEARVGGSATLRDGHESSDRMRVVVLCFP